MYTQNYALFKKKKENILEGALDSYSMYSSATV